MVNTVFISYVLAHWAYLSTANGSFTAATANLVVNYPEVRQLNPLKPLTRAEAAAHLYQALVRQRQLQPLASNVPAALAYFLTSLTWLILNIRVKG